LKTIVDPELMKRAPLTERQKLLLERIDVNHDSLTNVARELKKNKSTISIQHKKAFMLYNRWAKRENAKLEKGSHKGTNPKQSLGIRLDNLEERIRKIELSYPLERATYLGAVRAGAHEIGPSRAENCRYVLPNSRCEKLGLPDPKICGICPYYADKRALSESETKSSSERLK